MKQTTYVKFEIFFTKLQKLCDTALNNFGSRLIYYGPPLGGKLLFSPSKLASIIVLYGKLTFSPSKRAYLVYISPWYIHSYVFSRSGWNLCSGWSLLAMFYTLWGRLDFCSAWARYCWDFIVLLKLFFHIFDGLLVGQLSTKKCKYINHRNGLRGRVGEDITIKCTDFLTGRGSWILTNHSGYKTEYLFIQLLINSNPTKAIS